MDNHFDVIIIGGRNAGASLAIRLAKQNLKILLVDRANFPSLPQVPSSPILHSGGMKLLDEIGIKEETYAHPDARVDTYAMNIVNHFTAVMPTELVGAERNYCYGLDRNRFDNVLWETASKTENVTAYSGFTVSAIQKENGKVAGIVGKDSAGTIHRPTADLLVGADGRFSWTATKVGAKVVEERNEYVGTSYHAEWENVAPFSDEHPHTVGMYNTGKGFLVISIPIGTNKYIIGNYLTMDKVNFGAKNLESNYIEGLKSIPELWERLKNAQRTTDILGVKGIKNGYRQPYGDGWVLVGDALHYKDPIDGQGIYDALVGTKILAEAIHMWKIQGYSREESMNFYEEEFWKATHQMFLQTVGRIKEQVYTEPPEFIIKTLLRWMLNDPEYQANFLRYLFRTIDPSQYPTPHPKYIVRGIMRDLFGKKSADLKQPKLSYVPK